MIRWKVPRFILIGFSATTNHMSRTWNIWEVEHLYISESGVRFSSYKTWILFILPSWWFQCSPPRVPPPIFLVRSCLVVEHANLRTLLLRLFNPSIKIRNKAHLPLKAISCPRWPCLVCLVSMFSPVNRLPMLPILAYKRSLTRSLKFSVQTSKETSR